jgi:hypothetical protein
MVITSIHDNHRQELKAVEMRAATSKLAPQSGPQQAGFSSAPDKLTTIALKRQHNEALRSLEIRLRNEFELEKEKLQLEKEQQLEELEKCLSAELKSYVRFTSEAKDSIRKEEEMLRKSLKDRLAGEHAASLAALTSTHHGQLAELKQLHEHERKLAKEQLAAILKKEYGEMLDKVREVSGSAHNPNTPPRVSDPSLLNSNPTLTLIPTLILTLTLTLSTCPLRW